MANFNDFIYDEHRFNGFYRTNLISFIPNRKSFFPIEQQQQRKNKTKIELFEIILNVKQGMAMQGKHFHFKWKNIW